jgi:hypothetical protein
MEIMRARRIESIKDKKDPAMIKYLALKTVLAKGSFKRFLMCIRLDFCRSNEQI